MTEDDSDLRESQSKGAPRARSSVALAGRWCGMTFAKRSPTIFASAAGSGSRCPRGRLLQRFVDFLEQAGAERITTELALKWARLRARAPAPLASAAVGCGGFARHLATMPGERDSLQGPVARASPADPSYIYTDEGNSALMAAAGRPRPPLRAACYQTPIGLLAVTGMRPGEALALDRQDVDLRHGVVHVRAGKRSGNVRCRCTRAPWGRCATTFACATRTAPNHQPRRSSSPHGEDVSATAS